MCEHSYSRVKILLIVSRHISFFSVLFSHDSFNMPKVIIHSTFQLDLVFQPS